MSDPSKVTVNNGITDPVDNKDSPPALAAGNNTQPDDDADSGREEERIAIILLAQRELEHLQSISDMLPRIIMAPAEDIQRQWDESDTDCLFEWVEQSIYIDTSPEVSAILSNYEILEEPSDGYEAPKRYLDALTMHIMDKEQNVKQMELEFATNHPTTTANGV